MTKLIVGLGNPGAKYVWTRHNLGFLVIEALGQKVGGKPHVSSVCQGLIYQVSIGEHKCSLLMPTTFMNNSGISVKKLIDKQVVALEDVLVVCDDLDLPFGKLRLRPSGSAGGHNGLKSIIHDLGTNEFARLRMGIDAPQKTEDTVNYVLANFTPVEKKILPDFINLALDCVTSWVTEGAVGAMNKFN